MLPSGEGEKRGKNICVCVCMYIYRERERIEGAREFYFFAFTCIKHFQKDTQQANNKINGFP